MLYQDLSRKNEKYTPERWEELWELYKGGYYVLDNAAKFLPRVVGETPERYKQRLALTSYIGYFGAIVNMIKAQLFGQELAVTPAVEDPKDGGESDIPETDPFYEDFAKDCDTKETAFAELCKGLVRTALVQKCSYLGYDTKAAETADGDAPANRAEEEKAGVDRIYVYEIDPLTLIDWETDDEGQYTLAVLQRRYQRRTQLQGGRDKFYEEFKVWFWDATGPARWELYRTKEYDAALKEEPKPEDEVPLKESGTTSFAHIPILPFELADELWVGNHIAPMNREHFKRRSELVGAEQHSLFEIPVYKLAPEISAEGEALPSEAQQNPHRNVDPRAAVMAKGFVTIGSEDSIEFVGPAGQAYEIADKQIKELVDEMYRVVSMMAQSISSTSTALGRSGDSKQADSAALTVVLREFGQLVRKFAVRVYESVAEARKEDITWEAHGLENYDEEVRADLIQEALVVDTIGINSQTFKVHYKTGLAFKLAPEMDPETKELVRREIADSVEAEDSIRVSQQDNEQTIADEGPTPEELGKAPPIPGAGKPNKSRSAGSKGKPKPSAKK